MKRYLRVFGLVGITGVALYFISYFTLVVHDCPALDETNTVRYNSSMTTYRKEVSFHSGNVTVGAVSAWNRFYAPLDWIYYRFVPSNIPIGTQIHSFGGDPHASGDLLLKTGH